MATSKLSAITSGGAVAGATDVVVAVRSGATDLLVTPVALDTAQSWTAAQTITLNGAVSAPPFKLTGTWYSGGSATTTKPQYLIEPTGTTSTGWSTSGTGLGANAASGFAGNLADLQVAGVSKALINSLGNIGLGVAAPTAQVDILSAARTTVGFRWKAPASSAYTDVGYPVEIQSAAGATVTYIDPAGDVIVGAGLKCTTASVTYLDGGYSGNQVVITQIQTSLIGLVVKGKLSRTKQVLQLQDSTGASIGSVGGCVFDDFVDASTTHTDGTFDTLSTHTFAANALQINGDKIRGEATLVVVGHAVSTDQVQITFGGIGIFDSGALNYAVGATITIRYTITRATSTTCRATVAFLPAGSATILGYEQITYTPEATLTGMTLTGTNILVIKAAATGTNSASGDVKLSMGNVDLVPAA